MSSEFCSLISKEDYSYFSRIPNDSRRAKLAELAYQVRQAYVVLTFSVAIKEEFFQFDHFYMERERLNKKVGDLFLESYLCLEEVRDVFNYFLTIKIALEPLRYSGSLPEKVERLVQLLIDKDEALNEER